MHGIFVGRVYMYPHSFVSANILPFLRLVSTHIRRKRTMWPPIFEKENIFEKRLDALVIANVWKRWCKSAKIPSTCIVAIVVVLIYSYRIVTARKRLKKLGEIAWENGIQTVYEIYSFWTSISAVLGTPQRGFLTWSYRSSSINEFTAYIITRSAQILSLTHHYWWYPSWASPVLRQTYSCLSLVQVCISWDLCCIVSGSSGSLTWMPCRNHAIYSSRARIR